MTTSGTETGTVAAAANVEPWNENGHSASLLTLSSPIRIFLYFHKAIRVELDGLHRTALAMAMNGSGADVKQLVHKCHFLRSIYNHHCNAEDEVIFPSLDIRVKNVARTYSLEHTGERLLFDQLFTLLENYMKNDESHNTELASFTGALQTSISQHMSKEEEQVLPLINEKFSYEEQASLVWKFFCSIPVNMMADFLPWLSSSISPDERQDMHECLRKIVPSEKLLQQIISNWMDGIKASNKRKHCDNDLGLLSSSVTATQNGHCSCASPEVVKRDILLSDCHAMSHPVDDILHWHRAIEKELSDIAEVARNIKLTGDHSDLSDFNRRLQFIAEVGIFHSVAEDKIIFPAVNAEMSVVQEHADDKNAFDMFRSLIESIESSGAKLSVKFCSELCSQADHIMETVKRHFVNVETQVLPLARKRFSPEQQQGLVYQSLCVMPLRLIECVLPWLIGSLSEEEACRFLYNMHMAAPVSDTALVTLFSGWACKGYHGRICLSSSKNDFCTAKELKQTPENIGRSCHHCACASTSDLDETSICSSSGIGSAKASLPDQSCRVPDLGFSINGEGIDSQFTAKSWCSPSFGSSSPLNSSLFNWETGSSSSDSGLSTRPIDNIFKFHKAIQKDLDFLAVESGKLGNCDESFMRNFGGRFRLLWGLYQAHSNAEDDIVFPALESKENLHNVSHSYTLDHKQEEKLFEDISSALAELYELKEEVKAKSVGKCSSGSLSQVDFSKKYNELATRIHGMCKSIKVALDDHIMREEIVLWPLFDKQFSVEEQEKLVGRIIGTTGAEIIQSMLPWVTSALTQEEKNKMMDTWKRATKNTMFSEWLDEWWEKTPASLSQVSMSKKSILQESDMSEAMDESAHTSKPGCKEILLVNQNEFELQIRKVSHDSTLDPRKKDYLSQNLMTCQGIVSQEDSQTRTIKDEDMADMIGCCQSFRDSGKKIFGCEHYKRNCKVRAACCGKLFPCRFCHDEVSDHSMERKKTSEMMCYNCLQIQPVGPVCSTPSCNGLSMAKYYCPSCKFFDDEREVYHCPFCNLCRVGKGLGVDMFHCMNCNCCLAKKVPEHKCWEKSLESNCPICCEFMFTSNAPVKDLPCGHYMHMSCYQAYAHRHYICPICSKSMANMSVYFEMLDAFVASQVLPEEFRNQCQDILCNDCDRKGTASFHWVHHKCGFCGSYNTKLIKVDQDHSCSP